MKRKRNAGPIENSEMQGESSGLPEDLHENEPVLLLGAGASHGSEDQADNRPPLLTGLLDRLVETQPSWARLDDQRQTAFQRDFEQAMDSHGTPELHRDVADYFMRFFDSVDGIYRKMCRQMNNDGWQGGIFTLNHERIFERDAMLENLQLYVPDTKNDEVGKSVRRSMVYLHGACHLFTGSIYGDFYGHEPQEGHESFLVYRYLRHRDLLQKLNKQNPAVLCYINPAKYVPNASAHIRQQQSYWSQSMSQRSPTSPPVVIIGVSVPKDETNDNHIWKPLQDTQAPLVFCCGKNMAEKFLHWARTNRYGRQRYLVSRMVAGTFDNVSHLHSGWYATREEVLRNADSERPDIVYAEYFDRDHPNTVDDLCREINLQPVFQFPEPFTRQLREGFAHMP